MKRMKKCTVSVLKILSGLVACCVFTYGAKAADISVCRDIKKNFDTHYKVFPTASVLIKGWKDAPLLSGLAYQQTREALAKLPEIQKSEPTWVEDTDAVLEIRFLPEFGLGVAMTIEGTANVQTMVPFLKRDASFILSKPLMQTDPGTLAFGLVRGRPFIVMVNAFMSNASDRDVTFQSVDVLSWQHQKWSELCHVKL
ncbi:hypothetical protein [Acetobacter malorum]|uniref:hypothetical protein n=1 Tax=Acetobacter malorum TaxID=178901 RepID=UPI0039E896D0